MNCLKCPYFLRSIGVGFFGRVARRVHLYRGTDPIWAIGLAAIILFLLAISK